MPTVTIACRLPHGLKLRLFQFDKISEPVMGGGSRDVNQAREIGTPIVINGWAHHQNAAPRSQMASGFALTLGVDKEFWDKWLEQNKEHDAVKNGLIFAHEKDINALAEAKDKKGIKSGLERLDPKKLPTRIERAPTVAA